MATTLGLIEEDTFVSNLMQQIMFPSTERMSCVYFLASRFKCLLTCFKGLFLCMILPIAGTMLSQSESKHFANLIYFTGPAAASGRVFGLRLHQQITLFNLMLMRTCMEQVNSGAE